MSIRKTQDHEAGVALILAIFALLLLSAIALAMLFSSNTETSISVNYRDKHSAIYGALAGLQEARDRIHPLTGDLGVGANLSAGGLKIVPTALPSTSAPNVLYLINPAPGETVAPWNPSNKYFDTELCHESYFVSNLGVTSVAAGTPCPATSASVPSGSSWYAWYDNSQKKTNTSATGTGDAATLETAYQLEDANGNKIPLTYKWVRITLKSDNMTPVSVGTGNGTQVCWNGSHEEQLPAGYIGYNTDCTPISGALTNIAVTASGSGYTSAPTVSISGGTGSGATATAVVDQLPVGISSVTLTNPGAGYTSVPAVTITPTDGNGSGAIVNAAVNDTVPVVSVGPSGGSWATPPACYASGQVPTVSFSPAGATASATMTGNTCVYGFQASGSCSSKNVNANVTATNGTGSGFAGTVTAGSNKKADGTYTPSNAGNYTTVPTTFSVASPCSSVTITPTYGIQIKTVNVTAGGAYTPGSPPSVTFGGVAPQGGSPGGTATLSGTAPPGTVTGLTIPVGGNGGGYDANPTLTVAAPSCTPGPSCVRATATASIGTDYGVVSITITNPGSGYSQANPPTVAISPPSLCGGSSPPPCCGSSPPCSPSPATATASVGSAGTTMGGVYLLTALAVTPSGSRAMTQMEIGVIYNSYTFGIGGALTLIGPNPNFGTPHSNNFQMIGTDCPTCALPVPSGCNTTAVPSIDAIGIDDPTNATNPSAVETIIGDLAKPNNYIGANSAPDVVNANLGNPTAAQLNEFVAQIASAATNVYGTPTATVNNPSINLGTAANPPINVVFGNYSMGPSTGYGILVVTGTLTISGNYSWNGMILVIGNGASIMSGGGNGQIVGGVYVANTSGNTFGSPNASWNGGGGNGIQYDHCWADYMLSKIPPLAPTASASALQIISLRTLVY
jgi:hypothetical protein